MNGLLLEMLRDAAPAVNIEPHAELKHLIIP